MEYVWYACYGSNLSADRFKCYIEGGTCIENGREYSGCKSDKALWIDSKVKRFPGRMYFAKSSISWDGKGVAFYDPNGKGETIMRLYKITRQQFMEVRGQEGPSEEWYGNIVDLGVDEDGCSILTITNGVSIPENTPSEKYVSLILRALTMECGISADEAEKYIEACMSGQSKN